MRPLMLFAAGFGTRMGALTADRPKPLIPVAGRPLIDHALALARAAGAGPIVANLHYRGGQLAAHLPPDVALSWEDPILDTGGGLRAALPLLGPGPVFTLNTDGIFTGPNPLLILEQAWRPGMEALLLLKPAPAGPGDGPKGDFVLDAGGRIARADGPGLRYLGAQIVDPAGLGDIADEAFSLNRLWDRLIARGTAFGVVHPCGWCDVGRPEGIAAAEALLA